MKIVNAVLIGATSLFSSYVVAEACQITLSQPNVSFGRFKQDDIIASRKNWNRMPGKEVTAAVFCPQPRVMALFLQSTSGSNGGVLFGQKSRLALVASNILVDGHHYNLVRTSDRVSFTSAETPKEKVFLRNNDGILAYQNGLPVRGKQMSVTIKIIPVINDDQLRGISDNTELESALAWELLTTE